MQSLLWLSLCFLLPFCYGGHFQHDLFNYLLDRDGTQHSIIERPVESDNESVPVTIGFNVQQIIALDVKDQYLLSSIWLELNWKDVTLIWDPNEFGNITSIRLPIKLLWRPDILLFNSADDRYDGTWPVNAIVRYDGSISYIPPAMLRSTCKVDVRWFPFDEQHCMLQFGSWTYHDREVNITLQPEATLMLNYVKNGEFDVRNLSARRFEKFFQKVGEYDENYPVIALCFHLKRRDLFYFFNLILPSLLLMAVALLVFFLPPESGEKMGLSVTVLLSMTVYSTVLSESMPRTSDAVPLLGIYFLIIMMLCALAVATQVWSLRIHYADYTSNWMLWICTDLAKVVGMRTPEIILREMPHGNSKELTAKRNPNVRKLDIKTGMDMLEIVSDTVMLTQFAGAHKNHKEENGTVCCEANVKSKLKSRHPDENFRRQMCVQLREVTSKLEVLVDRVRGKKHKDKEAAICCFASLVVDRVCLYIYCLFAIICALLIFFWRPGDSEFELESRWCGNALGSSA